MGGKIYNYDIVKKSFEVENYTLLSKEYRNTKTKLEYICPRGHKHSIRYECWLRGQRCPTCKHIENGRFKKEKIASELKNAFESEGYKLLSHNYIDADSRTLKYMCPKGHTGYISWHLWKSGTRCKECSANKSLSHRRLEFDTIKSSFEQEGYTLLSTEYERNTQKLEYICPRGHRHSISWSNWQKGERCKYCEIERHANQHRHTIEYIKEAFESEGYTLLTKNYIDNRQKLDYICPLGHIYKISWGKWKQGQRCPKCYGNISKAEDEIYNLIKRKTPDAIQSDKTTIYPLQLDIYIPSKNIAVEYCGLYWHSEKLGKHKTYHLNKLEECNKKGIRLITIFEDEWLHNKDITISRLYNILGVNKNISIYARKCSVKEINTKNASDFCELHHIQGYHKSTVKLGLFNNNKLVSVMTFDKPSISKGYYNSTTNKVFELNRFCSDKNYKVVGAASKLLKYFIRNYNPKQIFSYADRRWSDGSLYRTLGFKLSGYSQPNYWYVIKDTRKHRFSFRKSVLKNKLKKFESSLTEYENMKYNGYDRIWDCGNMKYIIHL